MAAGYLEMLQGLFPPWPSSLWIMTWFFNTKGLQYTIPAWQSTSSSKPIENIWGWMTRKVYKNSHQFKRVDFLHEVIFTTLNTIPSSLLETIASSMPKHTLAVINMNREGTLTELLLPLPRRLGFYSCLCVCLFVCPAVYRITWFWLNFYQRCTLVQGTIH